MVLAQFSTEKTRAHSSMIKGHLWKNGPRKCPHPLMVNSSYRAQNDPKVLYSGKNYVRIDLVVHRRGVNTDNLIALEMKKSYQNIKSKDNDRERVELLTIPLGNEIAVDVGEDKGKSFTGGFGYILGVYYEINIKKKEITTEYYREGRLWERHTCVIRKAK